MAELGLEEMIQLTLLIKRALVNYYNVPEQFSAFDYALDRHDSSVIHTELLLDACALHYYLLKIAVMSSLLSGCGFNVETKIHFFLQCPNYAALGPNLLTAAARIVFDLQ